MDQFITQFHTAYGTALLVDAAFRAQVDFRVASTAFHPLDPQQKLAGPVMPLRANNDLVAVLEAVHRASAGQVIVIDNAQTDVGILGDVIATEARRAQVGGFVVDGFVRDVSTLLKVGIAVMCRGSTPVGPLKLDASQQGLGQIRIPIDIGGVRVTLDDWVFGDADGVLFLRSNDLIRVFEQAAISKAREDELLTALAQGQSLGDLLHLDAFLKRRQQDPHASFNDHLKDIGRAL